MANTANIKAVITAEDRASSVIKGFDNNLGRLTGTVKNLLLGGAGILGLSIGIDKLTDFVWGSVKAFAEEEVVTKRLQAGINNVTTATDKNIDGLLKQASALQKVTRFSDDQVISAQGILTTFQLNQSAIEKLTPRLIDMSEGIARVSGGLPDLEGNAMLVAKALGGEDVVGMVGALRRVGVIMTQHQTDLLNTGNMQERLSVITEVLDQNFKGMGETAGSTTSGHLAQLGHSVDDLKETFGETIAKALDPFIQKLTAWAQTDQAKAAIQTIAEKVVLVAVVVANFLRDNWPGIKGAFETMGSIAEKTATAIGKVADAIGAVVDVAKKAKGFEKESFLKNIGKALNIPVPAFASGVQNFSGGMAVVGEQGPELVNLPKGSDVIPNHSLPNATTVNITLQAGAFMGSNLEARKFAQTVFDNLKDIAGSKGMSLSEMLG